MSLYDLKPGDPVKVFDVNGRRYGQPEDGVDGEVVKVGRKLITVKHSRWNTQVFRLENGIANDNYGHQWIRTLEEAADLIRRAELRQSMRKLGLEIKIGRSFSTDTMEKLVQVLENAKEETDESA